MKILKLAALVTVAVTLNAGAMQIGTGSSVQVSKVVGTVTQVGETVELHQGIEVAHTDNGAGSTIDQLGVYAMSSTSASTLVGTLNDVTTTNKGFTFFDN